ncbi:MAG: hypothetical protein V3V47_00425 [Desulfobacteria bacterium]
MPNEFLIYASDYTEKGHLAEVHGHNAKANAILFTQAPALLRQNEQLVKALKKMHKDLTTMMYLYNADGSFTKQQLYGEVKDLAIATSGMLNDYEKESG